MRRINTQVGIVGAGPGGLLLSQLLHLRGIHSVILEKYSKLHIEHRVRAGHLEPATVEVLGEAQAAERLRMEGLQHSGVLFHYGGRTQRIDLQRLTGKPVTIYGQHEICKDLMNARLNSGGVILFDTSNIDILAVDSERPCISFQHASESYVLECDFIAGCDGYLGVCRQAIAQRLSVFERTYPVNWLGILATTRPVASELIYAPHERGLALFSMRSPQLARLYLQAAPDEQIERWPDARVWEELRARLEGREDDILPGPILDKRLFTLRSFAVEPMQSGRLFLVGDAAHIVPPSAAKGLNIAVADADLLAKALWRFYSNSDQSLLENYSSAAAARVWEGQRFSQWMTLLLHQFPNAAPVEQRLQRAELDRLFNSTIAATNFAHAYVGIR